MILASRSSRTGCGQYCLRNDASKFQRRANPSPGQRTPGASCGGRFGSILLQSPRTGVGNVWRIWRQTGADITANLKGPHDVWCRGRFDLRCDYLRGPTLPGIALTASAPLSGAEARTSSRISLCLLDVRGVKLKHRMQIFRCQVLVRQQMSPAEAGSAEECPTAVLAVWTMLFNGRQLLQERRQRAAR